MHVDVRPASQFKRLTKIDQITLNYVLHFMGPNRALAEGGQYFVSIKLSEFLISRIRILTVLSIQISWQS